MRKIIGLISPFFFIACFTVTNYQTPEVLKKGSMIIGAGISQPEGGSGLLPAVYFRHHLLGRSDYGIKLEGLPNNGIFFLDVKQGLGGRESFSLSGDLGFSVYNLEMKDLGKYQTTSIVPSIYFGNEHIYGGLRYNHILFESDTEPLNIGSFNTQFDFTSAVFGGTIGKKNRLQPEVIYINFPNGSPAVLFSLGFSIFHKPKE